MRHGRQHHRLPPLYRRRPRLCGEITHIDTTLIDHLLEDQFIPVIATVGMDPENGVLYNVNADTAAAAIAVALQAEKLVSMTDIAGLPAGQKR